MSVNKAILVGRIGRDPEVRFTGGGVAVANFSLATDESFKDRSGNKQKKTEWHRCIVWNKLAEVVQKYCTKGQLLYVEGSIGTRKWADKDGNDRYTTEITVRNLRMLGSKNNGEDRGNRETPEDDSHWDNAGAAAGNGSAHTPDISDEDIPF